jgi:isoleucyl-tRNA synthetase
VTTDAGVVTLEAEDVTVAQDAGEDWSAVVDDATVVLVDKRLTASLKQEGIARDIVRNVQNLRKDAGFNIEDRIQLSVQCDDAAVVAAVEVFGDYIATETLADSLSDQLLEGEGVSTNEFKLDKAKVVLQVARK